MQIKNTAFGMTMTPNGVKWAVWINGQIVLYTDSKMEAREQLRIIEKLHETK